VAVLEALSKMPGSQSILTSINVGVDYDTLQLTNAMRRAAGWSCPAPHSLCIERVNFALRQHILGLRTEKTGMHGHEILSTRGRLGDLEVARKVVSDLEEALWWDFPPNEHKGERCAVLF
jgi:hypothetical protein